MGGLGLLAAASEFWLSLRGSGSGGADEVWVLAPNREVESVVVFLHGWTATSPFDWHQLWLEQLLDSGSVVVPVLVLVQLLDWRLLDWHPFAP